MTTHTHVHRWDFVHAQAFAFCALHVIEEINSNETVGFLPFQRRQKTILHVKEGEEGVT